MSWTNNKFGLVDETTYGTPVTSGIKGYAITAETFTPEVVAVESPGFREGRQGHSAAEYNQVFVGGTGSITIPVPVDKTDALFKGLLGTHTALASNAFSEDSDALGPQAGKTLYVNRGIDNNGTNVEQMQYAGCICTGY